MPIPTTAAQLAPIIAVLKNWRHAAALPTLGSFAVALAVIDKTAAARKELLNILDRVMGEPCVVEQGTPMTVADVLNDAWTLASAKKLPREVTAALVPTLDRMTEILEQCAEPLAVVGGGDAKPAPERMTWQEAAERMTRLREQGDAWTSAHDLAGRLGCSSSTIQKGIDNTPELQRWARRNGVPRAQSLNAVVTDKTAQTTEPDPATDVAIREYIETATPEVKAWFLALPAEKQIEVASDPDRHPKILGRKP